MSKLAWGKGKREVYGLKPEILAFVRQGESLGWIFRKLSGEKRICVSRSVFCQHASAIRREAEAAGLLDERHLTAAKQAAAETPLDTLHANSTPRGDAPTRPTTEAGHGRASAAPHQPRKSFHHDPTEGDDGLW